MEKISSSLEYKKPNIVLDDFCKIEYKPVFYTVKNIINETEFEFEGTEDEVKDFIFEYDSNKIVLEKLSAYCLDDKEKCSITEIFACYITKSKNIHPIGFNYSENPIDKYDDLINKLTYEKDNISNINEFIDDNFVSEDGLSIYNGFNKEYNILFGNNYHIGYKENKTIHFFTLNDLLKLTKTKLYPDTDDINNKKIFYGIITKYFPLIQDINILLKYNDFVKQRNDDGENIRKYIENLYEKNKITIYDNYKKLKRDIANQCKNLKINFLKIDNEKNDDSKNYLNLVKLFCDIDVDDKVHFTKLSLSKNSSSHYKLNENKIKYLNNSELISKDVLDKFIKGHIILNEVSYEYLFIENFFVMTIFIPELHCPKIEEKYITLAFSINGLVSCVINCNIDKNDIEKIIETCNNYINKINTNLVYTEVGLKIKEFNIQFMNDLSRTRIDYLNCNFLLPLETKDKKKIIPFNPNNFEKIILFLDNFFRIEEKTKDKLFIRYKCVDNYLIDTNIRNIITKLVDPQGLNLPEAKVITELQEIFTISRESSLKYKADWDAYFKMKQEQGNNIFRSRKIELGARITLQQSGSYLGVQLSEVESYKQFEKIIIILEVLVYLYKNTNPDDYIAKKKSTSIAQNIVYTPGENIFSSDSELSDDTEVSEEEEEEITEDIDEPQKEIEEEDEVTEDIIDEPQKEIEEEDEDDNDDDDDNSLDVGYDSDGGGKGDEGNPKTYFHKILQKMNKDSFGKGYTRTCTNNDYRWACGVTRSELERILETKDVSGPCSFSNIIKSSDIPIGPPEAQKYNGEDIFFIAPRFFDMKERLSIREDIIYNSFIANYCDIEKESEEDIIKKISDALLFDDKLSEVILNRYNNFKFVSEQLQLHKDKEDAEKEKIIKSLIKDNLIFKILYKKEILNLGIKDNVGTPSIKINDLINELYRETKNMYMVNPLSLKNNYYHNVIKDPKKPKSHETILEKKNNNKFWDKFTTQNQIVVGVMKKKVNSYYTVCSFNYKSPTHNKSLYEYKWIEGYDYFNPDPTKLPNPKVEPNAEPNAESLQGDKQTIVFNQHINRLNDSGEIPFPLNIAKKGIVHPEIAKLLKQEIKSKTHNDGICRIGVPHDVIPSFLSAYYFSINPRATKIELEKFFNDLKNHIRNSLKNFLFIGNGILARISTIDNNYITDTELINFSQFCENNLDQIKELWNGAKDDSFLNFNSLEDFYNENDIKKLFIFNLFTARENYLSFLESDEELDDKYLIPLIEDFHNEIKIVVFEDIDNDIIIQKQLFQNSVEPNDELSLIFKKKYNDNYFYEPMIYFIGTNYTTRNIRKKLKTKINIKAGNSDKIFYEYINNDFIEDEIDDSDIKYVYVNSNYEISHIINSDGFIYPTKLLLEEKYSDKMIFDLSPYKKTLEEYKNNESLKIKGLAVENNLTKAIILFNNHYIPVQEEHYMSKFIKNSDSDGEPSPELDSDHSDDKYRIITPYDLHKIDKLLYKNTIDDNLIKTYESYIENKENINKFNKLLYYFIKNNNYSESVLHEYKIDDKRIKINKKYKFLVTETYDSEDKIFILKLYDSEFYNILDFDLYGKIIDIDGDLEKDGYYDIKLEINYIDHIICILNSFRTNNDKKIELYELLEPLISKIEIEITPGEINIYIHKFIDLLLIYSESLQEFSSVIEEKIQIKDLIEYCKSPNAIMFSSKEYHNGILDQYFSRESRFLENYYYPEINTKPLMKILTKNPSFLLKEYENSEFDIELPFHEDEIKNLSFILDLDGKIIKDNLKDNYESIIKKNNQSSIQKIKKYSDIDTILNDIYKKSYELTPTDFYFISKNHEVKIILYSNKYTNRYEELIWGENYPKTIILYHYLEIDPTNKKNLKYILGFIKINDKYIN
jgi:hypothetical protein